MPIRRKKQQLWVNRLIPLTWAPTSFSASVGAFAYFGIVGGNEVIIAGAAAGMFALAYPCAKSVAEGINKVRTFMVPGASCLKSQFGCQRIFRRRKDAMPDMVDALLSQIDKASGRVVIVAVSGREFLHHRWELQHGQSLLSHVATELNGDSSQVELSFIILDPDCTEAKRRASIEEANETIHELRASVENFERYFGSNQRVRLGLYQRRPWRFLLITNKVAFVQDYLTAPPKSWHNGCFGDLTKVESYEVGTEGYELAKGEVDDLLSDQEISWIGDSGSEDGEADLRPAADD